MTRITFSHPLKEIFQALLVVYSALLEIKFDFKKLRVFVTKMCARHFIKSTFVFKKQVIIFFSNSLHNKIQPYFLVLLKPFSFMIQGTKQKCEKLIFFREF